MTNKNSSSRNYVVDLLRIVSMIMVVTLHVLGRGDILSTSECMGTSQFTYEFGAINENLCSLMQ